MSSQGELFDTGPQQRCSQCGELLTEPACGMTHAAQAAELAAANAPSHFDTTHEPPEDVHAYRAQCGHQQRLVIDWWLAHPNAEATPFQIRDRVLPEAPITSARRAITNLATAGVLVKTGKKRGERLGRRNYLWALAPAFRATTHRARYVPGEIHLGPRGGCRHCGPHDKEGDLAAP